MTLQYGSPTSFFIHPDGVFWDQKAGVRLEWRWGDPDGKPPPDSIHLIDITQAKLDGVPVQDEE